MTLSYDMILENFRITENRQRTHREQSENSKPEATLIPVESWGERANYWMSFVLYLNLAPDIFLCSASPLPFPLTFQYPYPVHFFIQSSPLLFPNFKRVYC